MPQPRPDEGTFPKPSRDDATASKSMEEITPGAAQSDAADRYATGRRDPEASDAGEDQPPHVTANDSQAPVQENIVSEQDVPVLPANASGEDQVSTDDQPDQIDDESAYDRRPEEDKEWSSEDGSGSDGR
ncbi:hypothetical protein BH23GEM6_BH23GEM6_15460 [soil metagenome]